MDNQLQLTPKPLILDNLPDINAAWHDMKYKKIRQSPQNNLRASSIGNPCERFHFYSIKNWKDRELWSSTTQGVFDEGYMHEKQGTIDLMEMGFEIVEQQRAFQLDKPLITAHIDGVMKWKGNRYPYDLKSIEAHSFDAVNSAEDLLFSKKWWQRNYPAQLQTYLLATEEEVGAFILRNKSTGEMKPIWMQLDYDYMEQILKRAERVYKAVEKNEAPERVNDFDICERCPFKAICLPDLRMGKGIQVWDDLEFVGMLERREQLVGIAKEFEEIDDEVKDLSKKQGPGDIVAGDFLIRVQEIETTKKVALTYTEEKSSYLKTKIVRITPSKAVAS